jgi:hypothetical protein
MIDTKKFNPNFKGQIITVKTGNNRIFLPVSWGILGGLFQGVIDFPALLKSSKNIEHPLVFEETIDRENDTFQLNFFYLLSVRPRVDCLTKQSFQYRKNRFGHIPSAVGFSIE